MLLNTKYYNPAITEYIIRADSGMTQQYEEIVEMTIFQYLITREKDK